MAAVRAALAEALRALRAVGLGETPTADELTAGLEAAQALLLDLHEARGPMREVDVSADYVAGENQRVRVAAGATVAITLPNSVPLFWPYDPDDYGFSPTPALPAPGSTGAADNIQFRAPRDGARIEVVGTSQGLWFYRADLNQWLPAVGLTVDSELPVNNRLTSAFAALLAEQLADLVSDAPPTANFLKRVARGRQALFLQHGRERPHRAGEYF